METLFICSCTSVMDLPSSIKGSLDQYIPAIDYKAGEHVKQPCVRVAFGENTVKIKVYFWYVL